MGCPVDSDCITLELGDQADLDPGWVLHPDGNITCGPDGLLSPKLMTGLGCLSVADSWLFPPYNGAQSQFSPVATIANPSATRPCLVHATAIFGTVQAAAQQGGIITVTDLLGFGLTGTLNPASYPAVNTATYADHATFVAGGEVAFNAQTAPVWTCPFPVSAGGSIDVQFERRASLAGAIGALGVALVRATFVYLWAVVV